MKPSLNAVFRGLVMTESAGCTNYQAPATCRQSDRTPDAADDKNRWCHVCLISAFLDHEGHEPPAEEPEPAPKTPKATPHHATKTASKKR